MEAGPFDPGVESHDALFEQLQQLELLVSDSRAWKAIQTSLRSFSEALRQHFLSEEESWRRAHAGQQNAVLAETMRTFEAQHARMLQICRSLELTQGDPMSSCRDGLDTLSSMLRIHEREESDLLQRILDDRGDSTA